MSAPQATAPYDPLTAEARSLLFKTAAYLSQEDKQRLEKRVPMPSVRTTGKREKAASRTSRTRLPWRRNWPSGAWTSKP